MKKYTKRFKTDAREFRLIKNILAIGGLMVHAGLTLMGYEPIVNAIIAGGASIGFAIIGEVIFNGWMTIVETAESIQENKNNNETI